VDLQQIIEKTLQENPTESLKKQEELIVQQLQKLYPNCQNNRLFWE
jgi:hypothetical protein